MSSLRAWRRSPNDWHQDCAAVAFFIHSLRAAKEQSERLLAAAAKDAAMYAGIRVAFCEANGCSPEAFDTDTDANFVALASKESTK